MDATVRQNYRKGEIYNHLVDEHGVFKSYIDLFMFSACLGYSRGEIDKEGYEGDEDTRGEMLWMHFTDKDIYRATAASIAFQETGDPESLMDASKQLEIMAKYASGGADILEDEFGDSAGTPRDAILNMIQSEQTAEERQENTGTLRELEEAFDIGL